jgi:hypothetical protein
VILSTGTRVILLTFQISARQRLKNAYLTKNLSVCGYFATFAPTYLHNFSRCRREMLAVFLYICACMCVRESKNVKN